MFAFQIEKTRAKKREGEAKSDAYNSLFHRTDTTEDQVKKTWTCETKKQTQ